MKKRIKTLQKTRFRDQNGKFCSLGTRTIQRIKFEDHTVYLTLFDCCCWKVGWYGLGFVNELSALVMLGPNSNGTRSPIGWDMDGLPKADSIPTPNLSQGVSHHKISLLYLVAQHIWNTNSPCPCLVILTIIFLHIRIKLFFFLKKKIWKKNYFNQWGSQLGEPLGYTLWVHKSNIQKIQKLILSDNFLT